MAMTPGQELMEAGPPTVRRGLRGSAAGTLAAACYAAMIGQVSSSLPATLNGLFQEQLHPTGSQLTWISAAFLVPVVVLELTFGVLSDMYGRRRLLAGGAALLVLGQIVSAFAPGVQFLWLGQALAGLGAGAMFPPSLAMVAATTHTAQARARAIAIWAGFLSAGAVVSPVLSGLFATVGSWRLSFIAVAVLGLVSVVLTLMFARESSAPEGRALDWWGQVTLALGLVVLLYAVIQGPADGWGSPLVVAGFVMGPLLLVAFVMAETRTRTPLLQLSLFRNRSFSVASAATVIGMFAFLGCAYATSMWLGPIQHQDPMRVAVPFLLLQGPAFVLIPVVSRLLERVAARWLLTGGFLLMAIGTALASRLDVTDQRLTVLIVPLGLVGIGFALSVSSVTAASINTVPPHLAGMASATTNLLRDLGFALGPAVIGAVALSAAAGQFAAALPTAGLPADQAGAAAGIAAEAGPLAVNGLLPTDLGAAAHGIAMDALGHGFALGFAVAAGAAAVAALLTLVGMRSGAAQQPADLT